MFKRTALHMIFRSLLVATALATLATLTSHLTSAHAAAKATYTVIVGTDTSYGIESLAFFPQTLKVHKGDTVTWQFRGFHDMRFDQKTLDAVVVNNIDGKPQPEFNPQIFNPNARSGDTFKPGINSGVQMAVNPDNPAFSLVMDTAPGTYSYLCDVHPGMVGTLIVVDDQTAIPSPTDVDKVGQADLDKAIADADLAILAAVKKSAAPIEGNTLQVAVGLQTNNIAVTRFFPEIATIQVGQSVSWTVTKGFDPHTVNFPLSREGRVDAFLPLVDAKKSLHLVLGEAGNANVKSGAELPADGVARSGPLDPGANFTLKFTKPGVYSYYCAIHPDQFGIIEVVSPLPQ
jgi:plastocyanin